MNLTPIHQAILDLLVEDSYGLWEIAGRMQDLFPDRAESEAVELARQHVLELANAGLVSAWYQRGIGGEELPVPKDRVTDELAEKGNWSSPQDDSVKIRVLATDLGERAYYNSV